MLLSSVPLCLIHQQHNVMLIVCCYLVGALFYHDFIVNFYRHGVVNYDVDFIYALQKKSNYTLVMEPYQKPYCCSWR